MQDTVMAAVLHLILKIFSGKYFMSKRRARLTPSSLGQLADNSIGMYRNTLQWYEMLTASAMTIGMRLTAIDDDLKNNRIPNQKELQRMVTEKNNAMMKSTFALADWQGAILKNAKSGWPSINPNTLFGSGLSFWSTMLEQNIQLANTMLKGYSQVLKPFHAASTANAFRLSGTRKRKR